MNRASILVFCLASTQWTCAPSQRCALTPTTFYFQDQVASRSVNATGTTPKGIAVDSSGLNINYARIDRLTDETEACIAKAYPAGVMPPDVVLTAACFRPAISLTAPRSCMTVKVISDWFLSSVVSPIDGSKQQMIPGIVATGCTEKGMPSGDCYRRVGILNYRTIVTPPAMYLYKQGVVELMTGCVAPWSVPALAACMTPTTGPLDNGSEN
jgi:hypothetical protein